MSISRKEIVQLIVKELGITGRRVSQVERRAIEGFVRNAARQEGVIPTIPPSGRVPALYSPETAADMLIRANERYLLPEGRFSDDGRILPFANAKDMGVGQVIPTVTENILSRR